MKLIFQNDQPTRDDVRKIKIKVSLIFDGWKVEDFFFQTLSLFDRHVKLCTVF